MRRFSRCVAILALGILCRSTVVDAQTASIQKSRFQRLEQWLIALADHVPGTIDEPLRAFAGWSVADWQGFRIDTQAVILTSAQQAEHPRVFLVQNGTRTGWASISYDSADAEHLRKLSCILHNNPAEALCRTAPESKGLIKLQTLIESAAARGDTNYVLHLAALLHTDLAEWGGTRDAMATPRGQSGNVFLDVTDGRSGGLRQYGLQWMLAYVFLDRALFTPDKDLLTSQQYRASASGNQKGTIRPDKQDT